MTFRNPIGKNESCNWNAWSYCQKYPVFLFFSPKTYHSASHENTFFANRFQINQFIHSNNAQINVTTLSSQMVALITLAKKWHLKKILLWLSSNHNFQTTFWSLRPIFEWFEHRRHQKTGLFDFTLKWLQRFFYLMWQGKLQETILRHRNFIFWSNSCHCAVRRYK